MTQSLVKLNKEKTIEAIHAATNSYEETFARLDQDVEDEIQRRMNLPRKWYQFKKTYWEVEYELQDDYFWLYDVRGRSNRFKADCKALYVILDMTLKAEDIWYSASDFALFKDFYDVRN